MVNGKPLSPYVLPVQTQFTGGGLFGLLSESWV